MSAAYYRSLTADHTKVPSTQSDFPVLVQITDATLKTVANGGHVNNANGYDLGFYADSAGTTKLKWEIESYDGTSGALTAHVKIGSLSSSSNTVFYLLYGDPSVTTDQSDPPGVWSNGYVGVWHFGDGATLSTNDSLGAHNGTPGGPVAAITGQIRGGAFFQSPSYMAFGDIGVHGPPLTIEAWVAPYNNVYASILNTGSWDGYYLSHDPSGLTHAAVSVTGGFAAYAVASQASAGAMVWQHIGAVWVSDSSRQMFVNGSGGTIETTAIVPGLTPNGFVLGADWSHGNNFYGYLDEVRVSNVARSADWIATANNSQSSPGTFITLGAETAGTAPVSVFLTGVAANPQIGTGTVITAAGVVEPTGSGHGVRLRQPEDIFLFLEGVAAAPTVGEGVVRGGTSDIEKLFPFPRQRVAPKPVKRITAPRPTPVVVPETIVVHLIGPKAVSAVGTGTVKTVFELFDEEIVALHEAAA